MTLTELEMFKDLVQLGAIQQKVKNGKAKFRLSEDGKMAYVVLKKLADHEASMKKGSPTPPPKKVVVKK